MYKLPNVETKYFDQYSAGSLPVTGIIPCLTDITRGTDVIQRIGNQVTLKHMRFQLTTTIHPNGINAYMRVLLVLDKQGYNTPTIADVLEPLGLSSPFTAIIPTRWDYRKRFKILFDEKILLTQAAFTAGATEVRLPLNIVSQNIGASTTFTNQIYLILLTTEQNVLALPGYYFWSRVEFTDD